MTAGLGHDARLNGKFAGVYAEPGFGVEGQGEVGARRVDGPFEAQAGGIRDGEGGGDEFLFAWGVGVDVQAGGDAKVEGVCSRLAGAEGDLFGIKVLNGRGLGCRAGRDNDLRRLRVGQRRVKSQSRHNGGANSSASPNHRSRLSISPAIS